LEERISNRLLFLTTHSPVFIRCSEKVVVHAISNRDGKTATGRTLSAEELQEASSIIGFRPGHLAQADIVIYVEGKSGASVVDEWMKKWPGRSDVLGHLLVVVQACNADEMGTDDFDLTGLMKVSPYMVFFVDRDQDRESEDPKKARLKLKKECDARQITCIITERRQIEDYFTEEAVKVGLPSNVSRSWKPDGGKPMGEQFCNGWKRYNRRIAAAMQWDDIRVHNDIMSLFETIERIAKELQPGDNHA
jgi:hypothetical protein